MKAKYVSVWDGGTTVTTKCEYDPQTNVVSDIGSAEVEGLEICEDEYVELPDGSEIRDFIHEDDYEGSNDLNEDEISKLKSIIANEKSTGQWFTINLELESFDAKTPLEAVQEALRLMLEWEDGKQSCEGMIYDVTDNITGEKFTVDMSEDDENKVLPNND